MQTRIIIAGLLVIAAVGLAGAEPTPQPEWTAENDCEGKQIAALKTAATATLPAEAELALMHANAYGQLKEIRPWAC